MWTHRGWRRGRGFRTCAECRAEGWCVPMFFSTSQSSQPGQTGSGSMNGAEASCYPVRPGAQGSPLSFSGTRSSGLSALPSWRLPTPEKVKPPTWLLDDVRSCHSAAEGGDPAQNHWFSKAELSAVLKRKMWPWDIISCSWEKSLRWGKLLAVTDRGITVRTTRAGGTWVHCCVDSNKAKGSWDSLEKNLCGSASGCGLHVPRSTD